MSILRNLYDKLQDEDEHFLEGPDHEESGASGSYRGGTLPLDSPTLDGFIASKSPMRVAQEYFEILPEVSQLIFH